MWARGARGGSRHVLRENPVEFWVGGGEMGGGKAEEKGINRGKGPKKGVMGEGPQKGPKT